MKKSEWMARAMHNRAQLTSRSRRRPRKRAVNGPVQVTTKYSDLPPDVQTAVASVNIKLNVAIGLLRQGRALLDCDQFQKLDRLLVETEELNERLLNDE